MYSGTAALEPLERIMQEASDLALSWTRRREALVVDEKSAGQFASSADLDVEAMLRRCLAEEFGDGRIIGEEMGGDLGEGLVQRRQARAIGHDLDLGESDLRGLPPPLPRALVRPRPRPPKRPTN